MMRTTIALLGSMTAVGLVACGTPVPDEDAGRVMDAGSRDDGGPADAGSPTPDAGSPDAGRPDAGADAGPPDRDGDGVPDEVDCDPDDAGVGGDASRDCSNACGAGTEVCTDGTWAACTAPTDCLCATEGERRVVTCGMCGEGEQAEECMSGTWQPVSSCLGEGPCSPGDVERMEMDYCRVDERLCGSDCMWGDWVTVVPRGECTPGARFCSGLDQICNSMCRWEHDPTCP